MSNTAPSRANPVVVFPLGRWCPPQETSQPHPGSLPDFWSTSSPSQDIRTFVLPMLNQSPFPSMLVFQGISFCCNSSCNSMMMTKSSAYKFSQGHPVQNSWERASRTAMNNRAPLLGYIRLCALFQSYNWIQTGVIIQKRSIQVKIGNYLSCVTLKFDGWPWKTIGHLS